MGKNQSGGGGFFLPAVLSLLLPPSSSTLGPFLVTYVAIDRSGCGDRWRTPDDVDPVAPNNER